MNILRSYVERNRAGEQVGLTSICSAHPLVLEAAMKNAIENEQVLLIEATSNQVDHEGGYTGMTPEIFSSEIYALAKKLGLSRDNIILGGDHLGPNRWQHLKSAEAMCQAEKVVESYVKAGFSKIHLDCSMPCSDDEIPLSEDTVAKRAARLAKICEQSRQQYCPNSDIVYVIGTEVPVPGGTNETEHAIEVTTAEAANNTIETHRRAFYEMDLGPIWKNVIGLVVQPGVEFSQSDIIKYKPDQAQHLKNVIVLNPNIIFEAHSTDYQPASTYRELVRDHFAILKVGPALTFALREALYGLEAIEKELTPPVLQSNLRQNLEFEMIKNKTYWCKYYPEEPSYEQRILMHFSYSDRLRYYWNTDLIISSVNRLIDNLNKIDIPLPIIHQYFPCQYGFAVNNHGALDVKGIIIEHIMDVLRVYNTAFKK